jgi:hypothetical protein
VLFRSPLGLVGASRLTENRLTKAGGGDSGSASHNNTTE